MNEHSHDNVQSFLEWLAGARVAILFAFHAAVFAATYAFSYLVRFEFAIPNDYLAPFKYSFVVVVGVQLVVGIAFEYYRGWWRYVGLGDVIRLVFGLSVS